MKVAVDLKQVVTFSQTMFSWDMRRWAYDIDVDAKLYYFLINSSIQRLTLDSDFILNYVYCINAN
jgi:ribosomal protein S6